VLLGPINIAIAKISRDDEPVHDDLDGQRGRVRQYLDASFASPIQARARTLPRCPCCNAPIRKTLRIPDY
jgi:hypothetical protein